MDIESKIEENIKLADLTTFKIGGPARFLLEVETKEELEEAQKWAQQKEVDIFVLGGGSNVLVSDEGFDGLVLKFTNRDIEIQEKKAKCGAGASIARIIQETSDLGLSGLEWAAGIPGMTAGGAIRGNAGAFGFKTSDLVRSVEVYNSSRDQWWEFTPEDCRFDYRESVFKYSPELIIWKAELEFQEDDKNKIKETIKQNVQKRVDSQPRHPSAGSIFKNFTWEYLQNRAPSLADRAQYEGVVKGGKIGAGWVIDQFDFRGKKMGGAQVSEEHANFIINTGSASALDVITLVSYIKQKVRQEFNLQLREEIQYVGF